MADPIASSSSPPVYVESTPASIATPESRNVTPPPVKSPGPLYNTIRRPPPDSITPSEPDNDDELRTININITINIPSSLKFPAFRRRCWDRKLKAAQTPKDVKKRRFLAFIIAIFYISFIVCGSVAWHLKNDSYVWQIPHAPLIIETFAPLLDLFATVATIFVIKRHNEGDKPAFRYAILFLVNFLLFVLHLTIMILAAVWIDKYDNNYWTYYSGQKTKDIAGLMLYNTVTMIVIKIVLLLAVIRQRSLRKKFGQSVVAVPAMIGQEYRYQALTQDVDQDASRIESARNSTEQGRIYLA